jgi:hypothetical protein
MAVNTFGRSRTEIGSLLMRLAGYRALMLLGLIFVSHTAAAAEADMMPIISAFRHWDHHWYIWLPGDPKYEAVEVMSNDLDAAMPSLVWVFFTERAAPKRQVHYFNDARVATARGGNYREIAFAMTGAEGEPRGIMVSLNDVDGRAVAIEVEFGPEVQLTTRGAGLTDQSGHSADRHLLLFFREKNAIHQTGLLRGMGLTWLVRSLARATRYLGQPPTVAISLWPSFPLKSAAWFLARAGLLNRVWCVLLLQTQTASPCLIS